MAALRSSDMSSYLALLQQTKNTRLQQVLAQTDACLAQIAHKLGQATQTLPATKPGEGREHSSAYTVYGISSCQPPHHPSPLFCNTRGHTGS